MYKSVKEMSKSTLHDNSLIRLQYRISSVHIQKYRELWSIKQEVTTSFFTLEKENYR